MQLPDAVAASDSPPTGAQGVEDVVAPAGWRQIDFISDLHLSEDHPLTFAAFEAHLLQTPAEAVFILGDLFDLWVGDDARHGAFESRCAAVLTEAAAGRDIAFMVGNRDFLVGAEMLNACGVRPLRDPTVLVAFGQRMLLSHGDAWCVSDTDYQRFRAQVRGAPWQADFLALPLAQRRAQGAAIRAESERRKRDNRDNRDNRDQPAADVDFPTAVQHMTQARAPLLVHGHTHRPGSDWMAPGFVREVLSDWELDDPAQPMRTEVLRWSADGLKRVAPAGTVCVSR